MRAKFALMRVDNLWSIRWCVVCLCVVREVFFASVVQGYVFEGAAFEKSGPESIRNLLHPESG